MRRSTTVRGLVVLLFVVGMDRWSWQSRGWWRVGARRGAHRRHQALHEALRRGEQDGNLKLVRQLTGELAVWFDGHAKSMDAVLAMFLKEVQYDTETRIVHKPQVLPEGVAAGECGVPLDEASSQA